MLMLIQIIFPCSTHRILNVKENMFGNRIQCTRKHLWVAIGQIFLDPRLHITWVYARLFEITIENDLLTTKEPHHLSVQRYTEQSGCTMRNRQQKLLKCPMCDGPIMKLETEEWIFEQCFICCHMAENHPFPRYATYSRDLK